MHDLAEHIDSILGILGFVTTALLGVFVYIWKGHNSRTRALERTQSECITSLTQRFVPVETYREDIKDILKRQTDLRDRLPKDFIMRSEADMFLGSVKELKGEIAAMRDAFEGRMDRLIQQLIRSEQAR